MYLLKIRFLEYIIFLNTLTGHIFIFMSLSTYPLNIKTYVLLLKNHLFNLKLFGG